MAVSQTDHRFVGNTALVTGAGSGIGRATTLELAARGAYVVAADVNEPAAQETATPSAQPPSAPVQRSYG